MMGNDPLDDLMGAGADASSRFVDQLTIRSARVRHFLWNHRPFRARADLKEANRDAEFLEKQVIRLHRSLLALEQHLASLDDLSEEEIYTRANDSLHEDFLFLQESGLLNKDDLLQFIKKNGRNVDNVLDIKCCYEDDQHLVWKGLADLPDGKRYITTRMVVFREGKRWRSIGTREEVSKNVDKIS